MFCYKCGSELPDEAKFCQKCGTKLTGDDMKQQAAVSAPDKSIQQMQQPQAVTANTPEKKKSGKLTMILGAVILIIIGVTAMATKAKSSNPQL